ncbi:MAG TPA: RNA polymerase sigma factor [Rhizomicrobium sp.]|nr:RNA polymerase sigma factor [Rhizomicrobium sp.]
MNAFELKAWFVREVLPLEAALMQFLQHNWRNKSDIADLRQDVYLRVCEAALKETPLQTRQFVFTTARNLLIDRVRRAQVIPIEAVADLDALEIATDTPGPDRVVTSRDELRQLQAALDRLAPRCRETIVMGRIEGLSGREIAQRMGVSEGTVSEHLAKGMRALADILYGDPVDLRRRN